MWKIGITILLVSSFDVCNGKGLRVYNNITDIQYDSMPPLFHLDNFDSCLTNKPSLYCYATIQLSPRNKKQPSDIWKIIDEVISLPRNYRHDRLRHGICIPSSCPHIQRSHYTVGNGSEELWKGISKCYSDKYKHMGLRGEVTRIHCESENKFYEIDTADVIYTIVVAIIILATIAGTFGDWYISNNASKDDNNVQRTSLKILKAFSIVNNWERLRSETQSEDGKMLAPIQGVRVYNLVLVIISHTIMVNFQSPIYNPKYVEDCTTKTENMIFSNGHYICQTSLCIAGWLLSYSLCVMYENQKNIKLKQLVFIFINRYLRLVPLLLLVIGFEATWLRHIGRGPIWEWTVGAEFRNCRKNWLWNILFVNNIVNVEEMCLQQTWYLSVDMHGFILGLILMTFVLKNPKHANKIFASSILFFVSIATLHHYYEAYDILTRSYAETAYAVYLNSIEWKNYFIATHVSTASYIQGLVYGYYFYKFRKQQLFTSKISKILWFVFVWGVPLTIILIAIKYYAEGSEYTRLEAALYQAVTRYIFAMAIGLLIFGLVFGTEWYMISTCTWGPLQVLARTTFVVYLIHTAHMRVNTGQIRTPIYISDYKIFLEAIGDIVVSFVIGVILCVVVEMPISALQKIILTPSQKPKAVTREDDAKKVD